MKECHLLLVLAPCRFVEPVISFVIPPLVEQAQSQMIEWFAVLGVGIPCLKAGDCPSEKSLCLDEQATLHQHQTVGIAEPAVRGIAGEPFQIVRINREGSMTVLLQMECSKPQLLTASDILGIEGRLCRFRKFCLTLLLLTKGQNLSTFRIDKPYRNL
ncbi:hypothetical protein SDC9_102521 [bioreactor metagenome]|uniref:Uncharacterized protein n=1 Tax=bioreactor metagenome TaxID=1076179 RepID=A0A645B1Y3_9ZZZZ